MKIWKNILRNMSSSGYLRNGSQSLTRGVMVIQFYWIYLKHDCLSHYLSHYFLTAKLDSHGSDVGSLNFLLDYVSFSKHIVKVDSSYSKRSEIWRRIPQNSILGPLLFNTFINDVFFFVEKSDICNVADDNTTYSCGIDLPKIKKDFICLKILFRAYNFIMYKNIFEWFRLNS